MNRVLEFELVFENCFEVIDIVEIIYRIGRLGAHPFLPYHQINDFSEISGGFDAPRVQHQHRQSAPSFYGQLFQPIAEFLAADVLWLGGNSFGCVAEPLIDEPHRMDAVASFFAGDSFEFFCISGIQLTFCPGFAPVSDESI